MASTTTFGDFPGVRVQTAGGAITGVVVGRTQKLVIFGEADISAGTASANDPTQIRSRRDAAAKFGDSELAEAMRDALANGANINYLYGVAVEKPEVQDENFASVSSGTLANAPIVEDESEVTFTDTNESVDLDVVFKYESAPSGSPDENTVHLNPFTGEWVADTSSTYDVDYKHQEWSAGIDAAKNVVNEDETGIYATLSEAESVASTLESTVNTLRKEYKMIRGLAGAQPNKTEDDGTAVLDTSSYDDAVDNDAMFLYGPTRKDSSTSTVAGAIAGLLAGNAVDNPVYNEALTGVTGLSQKLTKSEADELRDTQVMPVRDMGSVRLRDNLSTATGEDWTRDFWRRRIVDQTILIAKQVGETIFGRINNTDTRQTAEELIGVEMRGLVRDGLIQPNTANEENWYVDVYEDGTDQVGIDLGIAPFGIVKRIGVDITVDA